MGRATVRAAISTYLEGAEITNLGKVFDHPPRITSEQDFVDNVAPGLGQGAVIWIFFQRQSERRAAFGGPTGGQKFRTYRCVLICLLKSKRRTPEEADTANDDFIDSLVSAIEANRVAGDANAIFQWGEGDTLHGVDIEVESHLPRAVRQQTFSVYSTVTVQVMENLST